MQCALNMALSQITHVPMANAEAVVGAVPPRKHAAHLVICAGSAGPALILPEEEGYAHDMPHSLARRGIQQHMLQASRLLRLSSLFEFLPPAFSPYRFAQSTLLF